MKSVQFVPTSLMQTLVILMTLGTISNADAETTLERVKAQGKIRVGSIIAPPFAYREADGKLTGDDPEIAKAILKKLGVDEIEPVISEFGSLIPGLKVQRIDMIAAGMYITPKRCEEIAFSEPIFRLGEAILIKRGNPKKIEDILSFVKDKNLKLAVVVGTTEPGYSKDAGVDASQMLIVRDNASLVAAVQSGRADGGALPAIQLADIVKKSEDLETTRPFFEVAGKSVAGYGGFGFRKEDKDLIEAFNVQLKTFIGSPEHIALVSPFGFGRDFLPTKSTAELCAGK
ncbi:ectoine/hydroxyectoine ABC transporter substrate-binding protein EhuB [Bradyrhizobium sp. CNPSo 4010]|uniref:Ectoine/hydroxyectoine ABC transporter substrate-binding protein EhuB n=2 Tax=Bradyrhizobium agreste TaxID=2751811 RepID=A0ABS0PGG5_9BRAD|nr:ectoine/hydroxyectoine ABC transporter substrate-binding protein EhuB [Bradyrhizobium agreste]